MYYYYMLKNPVYIVAVSGGVDSVVLLHKIMASGAKDIDYVVAHFDHGIRPDSHEDAEFVQKLADEYGLIFELGHGNLGEGASEDEARKARYEFLRSTAKKHGAERIITAHHQDDILETMVINIVRGTGPRGLIPMSDYGEILRPLLNSTKQQLIEYAENHDISWREDSTNQDETYLRNYVRKNIIPKMESATSDLLQIRSKLIELYGDIDMRVAALLPPKNILNRAKFVSLSFVEQKELVRAWLTKNGVRDMDSEFISRLAMAIKVTPTGKQIDVKSGLILKSEKQNVILTSS